MVLGFSWLVEKVMKKRKEQGIRLIVVKVEIVEYVTMNRMQDPVVVA